MGLPATFFVVSQFVGSNFIPWWDEDRQTASDWMNWEQVQTLKKDGFDIGSHTRSHADLGQASPDEAYDEIVLSCEDFKKRGITVKHFAYPFGGKQHMNEINRALVREAGYRSCCSLGGGTVTAKTDPFDLGRIPISDWYISPYHFAGDILVKALKCIMSSKQEGSVLMRSHFHF
jgi:peptidoglycan/xylan/chitin deacetylase (PgdA/CDA1 family)